MLEKRPEGLPDGVPYIYVNRKRRKVLKKEQKNVNCATDESEIENEQKTTDHSKSDTDKLRETIDILSKKIENMANEQQNLLKILSEKDKELSEYKLMLKNAVDSISEIENDDQGNKEEESRMVVELLGDENPASAMAQQKQQKPMTSATTQQQQQQTMTTTATQQQPGLPDDIFPSLSAAAHIGLKGRKQGASAPANIKAANGKVKRTVPTITTYGIDIKLILNSITHTLGHKNFYIKIVSRNVTNVQACSVDDHAKLRKLFEDQKVHFYTYTPKSDKPINVTVRGLSGAFEEEEVKDYIASLNLNVVLNSAKKLGGNSWLFSFARDSDMATFYKVRYILHSCVTFESFRRNSPTQCFRCQRFGHVSMNCNMPLRCVKCGLDHGTGTCPIPKKMSDTEEVVFPHPVTGVLMKQIGHIVTCVNCKTQGHTAGSKDCPLRIAAMRRLQESRAAAKNSKNFAGTPSRAVRPNVSYASVTNTNRMPQRSVNASNDLSLNDARATAHSLNTDCNRIFGMDAISMLKKVRPFAKQLSQIRDEKEKSEVLLGMFVAICQYE